MALPAFLVPLLLSAVSAGGAAIGGKRQYINENWLNEKFGTHAFTKEMADMLNYLVSSNYGQQMLSSAAEQASQFGNATNAAAARAGMGGGEGGESGASTFAVGAADSAGNSFRRDVLGTLGREAQGIVAQNMGARLAAIMGDRQSGGIPHPLAALGQALSSGASMGALAYDANRNAPKTNNTTTPTPTPTPAPATPPAAIAPVRLAERQFSGFTDPNAPTTFRQQMDVQFGPRARRMLGRRGLLYSGPAR